MDYATGQQANVNYAAQNAAVQNMKPIPRQQTQMEMLGERIGSAKRRLISMNDMLASKLDSFSPTPQAAATSTQDPEPAPGSLPSLRTQSERLHNELDRLDSLLVRLNEIF